MLAGLLHTRPLRQGARTAALAGIAEATGGDAALLGVLAQVSDSDVAGLAGEIDPGPSAVTIPCESRCAGLVMLLPTIHTVVGEALGWARKANPGSSLLYNDFNVGEDFEKLVADLLAASAPMDAIGIQSHFCVTSNRRSKGTQTG